MKKLFKAIIDDIKSDIAFLKSLHDGTYKLPPKLKKEWENFSFKQLFIDIFTDKWTYVAIMILILAFMSGFVWADVLNHNRCVDFINAEIIPKMPSANDIMGNFNWTIPINP
jgi:hypothetical protein